MAHLDYYHYPPRHRHHHDLTTHKWGVVTPPAVEPVVPSDLRAHCRVDDDPTYLIGLETACREVFEDLTRLTLVNTVYTASYDHFPHCGGGLVIPKRPLVSVSSVTYYDEAGTQQTLDASTYLVDSAGLWGRVVPSPTAMQTSSPWPATQCHRPNAVVVTFTAGHGGDATTVPQKYKLAIAQHVEASYMERAAISDIKYQPVPYAYEAIVGLARTREI